MIGSNAILTSVADAEILANTAQRLTDFELMNDQACTISINGNMLYKKMKELNIL